MVTPRRYIAIPCPDRKENMYAHIFTRKSVSATIAILSLAACGGGGSNNDGPNTPTTFGTLDGKAPLIIAHRGLPGLFPEETLPAYVGATDAGADSLELDMHLSKDCVLVVRHNPWLSDNTNVAQVAATNPADDLDVGQRLLLLLQLLRLPRGGRLRIAAASRI